MEVLDQNLGTVGLERHAVVAIVDDTVLNDDVAATVRVPAIGVLCRVV